MIDILKLLIPALFGLAVWRYQLIAKRRYEVAEQILKAVIQVVRAIEIARLPILLPGEGATRPRSNNEATDRVPILDALYVPSERLSKTEKAFSELSQAKIFAELHFGERAAAPLQEFLRARSLINFATRRMIAEYGTLSPELVKSFNGIMHGSGNDEVTVCTNQSFDEIKQLCAIQLRPHWITLLFPFVRPEHVVWFRTRAQRCWNRATGGMNS